MKPSIENNPNIALSLSKGSSDVHNCRMLPTKTDCERYFFRMAEQKLAYPLAAISKKMPGGND